MMVIRRTPEYYRNVKILIKQSLLGTLGAEDPEEDHIGPLMLAAAHAAAEQLIWDLVYNGYDIVKDDE